MSDTSCVRTCCRHRRHVHTMTTANGIRSTAATRTAAQCRTRSARPDINTRENVRMSATRQTSTPSPATPPPTAARPDTSNFQLPNTATVHTPGRTHELPTADTPPRYARHGPRWNGTDGHRCHRRTLPRFTHTTATTSAALIADNTAQKKPPRGRFRWGL